MSVYISHNILYTTGILNPLYTIYINMSAAVRLHYLDQGERSSSWSLTALPSLAKPYPRPLRTWNIIIFCTHFHAGTSCIESCEIFGHGDVERTVFLKLYLRSCSDDFITCCPQLTRSAIRFFTWTRKRIMIMIIIIIIIMQYTGA